MQGYATQKRLYKADIVFEFDIFIKFFVNQKDLIQTFHTDFLTTQ